ncbi:MAG: hypothetical protein IH948_02190 [Bacteroidetes bacterium]|nr:hypothetical protein [Bacteroidota bacterium]
MRTLLLLIVLATLAVLAVLPITSSAYAQTISSFGYKILPEKILENSEGIIQVYEFENDLIMPYKIEDLKVTSSNTEIIQIIDIEENENGFISNVRIKAMNPGTANIAIASHGFYSLDFPITVYTNNNFPAQILMKLTPNDFPIDGPKNGFIGIELATTDGLPTKANEDIKVSISTPNTNVLELQSNEVIIKKGDYYIIEEFTIINPGDALVFAEVSGMKRVSDIVHVRKPNGPLTVQLYTYPSIVNSDVISRGYAIVQLQDAESIPVLAVKDIFVQIQVSNPDAEINTSSDYEELQFSDRKIVIKKGTYWAYTSFSPRPTQDEIIIDVDISTEDYRARGGSVMILKKVALVGNGPTNFELLPVLATGKRELIGVVYLMTEDDVPVLAGKDLTINFDTSNNQALTIEDTIIKMGESVGLVFGQVGVIVPPPEKPLELTALTTNEEITRVTHTTFGANEDDVELVIEQLIPQLLVETEAPFIAYTLETGSDDGGNVEETTSSDEEEDGRLGITYFIDDMILTFTANEFIEIDPQIIKRGQSYVKLNINLIKPGLTDLVAHAGGYDSITPIKNISTKPAEMYLVYLETMLPHTSNNVAIQVLDSRGNPVYANNDIKIKLVSNNEEIIEVPDTIIIKKDDYHAIFVITSKNEGNVELATLSANLPLAKFDITVQGILPVLSVESRDYIKPNDQFDFIVTAEYLEEPLEGMYVEWEVSGAEIKKMDTLTDDLGKATITMLPDTVYKNVKVEAQVSGVGISKGTISKTIGILQLEIAEGEKRVENGFSIPGLDGVNLLYLIIPIVAGVGVIIIKKTSILDGFTEKLNIEERLDEIKEKMSEFRNK